MAQLSKKIELYAAANSKDGGLMDLDGKEVASVEFEKHVKLREDGSEVYIYEWNLSIPQPTTEQLNSYETAANAAEADIAAETQNKINKKASGKQKLKDLGLDDDEIQALIGV